MTIRPEYHPRTIAQLEYSVNSAKRLFSSTLTSFSFSFCNDFHGLHSRHECKSSRNDVPFPYENISLTALQMACRASPSMHLGHPLAETSFWSLQFPLCFVTSFKSISYIPHTHWIPHELWVLLALSFITSFSVVHVSITWNSCSFQMTKTLKRIWSPSSQGCNIVPDSRSYWKDWMKSGPYPHMKLKQ